MSTPCNNGISIPILETDLCQGSRINATCVIYESLYSELSLSANATQQEINQAIYLAYLNLKATTDNIDATVSGLDGSETKIEAGDNVEITGSGTTVNPYTIGLDFDINNYQLKNIPDDIDVASALNEGKLRYRTDANNSYVDISMRVGVGVYSWINIVSNNF